MGYAGTNIRSVPAWSTAWDRFASEEEFRASVESARQKAADYGSVAALFATDGNARRAELWARDAAHCAIRADELEAAGTVPATWFDYDRQAWVVDGVYVTCGHPEAMACGCYGRAHAGEPAVTR